MKVIIDGVEVAVLNDVKIIWEDIEPQAEVEPSAEGTGEVHLTANHEGVVIDIVSGDEVIRTGNLEAEDLEEWTV